MNARPRSLRRRIPFQQGLVLLASVAAVSAIAVLLAAGARGSSPADASASIDAAHWDTFVWSLAGVGAAIALAGIAFITWLTPRSREMVEAPGIPVNPGPGLPPTGRLAPNPIATSAHHKQFTSDAAHELRTPVTIILSETGRVLQRERTADEYRQVVITSRDAAERLRHLIDSLLSLAQMDAVGLQLESKPCDLATLAGDANAHMEPIAEECAVHVSSDLGPAPCLGDPAALSLLIFQLVNNAVQHNRADGNVRVTTRAHGSHAIVTVADDGPGIPAEDLPHIFKRFYRANKVRTTTSTHTGLGLAIAKTIVDNHCGTIEVTSRPNGGATFTVKLPLAAGAT